MTKPTPMTCDACRDLLSDHFDGRYPEGDPLRMEIEAHLAACPSCRGVLSDYALLRNAVSPSGQGLPDPAAFEQRLKDRLAEAPGIRSLWTLWRLPAAAAAALLVAAGTAWMLGPGRGPEVHVPTVSALPATSRPLQASHVQPPNWKLIGEISPFSLADAAEARNLSDLVEEMRLVRGPQADPDAIYQEVASLRDLSTQGPILQKVVYAP